MALRHRETPWPVPNSGGSRSSGRSPPSRTATTGDSRRCTTSRARFGQEPNPACLSRTGAGRDPYPPVGLARDWRERPFTNLGGANGLSIARPETGEDRMSSISLDDRPTLAQPQARVGAHGPDQLHTLRLEPGGTQAAVPLGHDRQRPLPRAHVDLRLRQAPHHPPRGGRPVAPRTPRSRGLTATHSRALRAQAPRLDTALERERGNPGSLGTAWPPPGRPATTSWAVGFGCRGRAKSRMQFGQHRLIDLRGGGSLPLHYGRLIRAGLY